MEGAVQVRFGCGGCGGNGIGIVGKNFMKIRVVWVRHWSGGGRLLFAKVAFEEFLTPDVLFFIQILLPKSQAAFGAEGRGVQGVERGRGIFNITIFVEEVSVN